MDMQSFMESRNQLEFQEKIQKAMEAEGLDSLILTTPQNVYYATGFLSPFMYNGSCPPGTDIAIVNRTGKVSLVVGQFAQGGAEQQTKGDVDVIGYPTWIFIEDYINPNEKKKDVQPDAYKTYRLAADVAKKYKNGGKVGIEAGLVPYDKYVFLQNYLGADNLVDATQMLIRTRMIKTKWEIDILRYAAQTAEKIMDYVMEHTEPGMTEADLNKMWHQASWEITGGHEIVYSYQAHTVGPDFWASAISRERPLEEGDLVRLDGGVNIYGYNSDLGRTYAVGEKVAPERQAIFDTLLAARDAGIAKMVPGTKLCDVFHAVMKVCTEGALPQFVRGHVGHSISLGPTEEFPMLSPDNEMVLEPGMVFCFETPYYSSKYHSYNLEDTLVITEDGHELFTNTNRSLFVKK